MVNAMPNCPAASSAKKSSVFFKSALIIAVLPLAGYFFYEKFPLVVRKTSGDGESLTKILTRCGKSEFGKKIPFETEDGFYIYRREYSMWSLTAFGKVKSGIDLDMINKYWNIADVFSDPNIESSQADIKDRYYSIFKKHDSDDGKNGQIYTAVMNGSTVFLRFSTDERYYHILIWHR